MPRAVPPSSYPQHSICRESKPSLCFYYFLFIPQEEFIQSSFEQQDPGLFFPFFTGIEKTNRTSAGNIQAGLCCLSITQREGRSTNKTLTAAQLLLPLQAGCEQILHLLRVHSHREDDHRRRLSHSGPAQTAAPPLTCFHCQDGDVVPPRRLPVQDLSCHNGTCVGIDVKDPLRVCAAVNGVPGSRQEGKT